jgi:hypothetical protein
MAVLQMKHTAADYIAALDALSHAHDHVASQFSLRMLRADAQAHFDARAILIRARFAVLHEAEAIWGTD